MATLLTLDPVRVAREVRHAAAAFAAADRWRLAWLRVYAQCLLCFLAGYVMYGMSWGASDPTTVSILVSLSQFVAYAVPLFRLLSFYLKHADQF
ncbi:MAG: hypothetical protein HOP28_16620 [Gemmatimonadales bacterium]|nr:hypothetical protein [Gemmatimonadales bacterium]